jgi:hypothetical protein
VPHHVAIDVALPPGSSFAPVLAQVGACVQVPGAQASHRLIGAVDEHGGLRADLADADTGTRIAHFEHDATDDVATQLIDAVARAVAADTGARTARLARCNAVRAVTDSEVFLDVGGPGADRIGAALEALLLERCVRVRRSPFYPGVAVTYARDHGMDYFIVARVNAVKIAHAPGFSVDIAATLNKPGARDGDERALAAASHRLALRNALTGPPVEHLVESALVADPTLLVPLADELVAKLAQLGPRRPPRRTR